MGMENQVAKQTFYHHIQKLVQIGFVKFKLSMNPHI